MIYFARRLFAGLLMTCVFASASAQVSSTGQSLPGLEAFDEAMQTLMSKYKYPGGSLAVAYQGRLVFNKAYGDAKRGFSSNTPMTPGHRMRIGSMSKLITAVAALKAVEQGVLDLDRPFVDIMGYSKPVSDYADARITKVTLRQLLQNHAGWTIDRSRDPVFDPVPKCPHQSLRWLTSMKLDAEPGHLYSYSNISFCLAQQAIEKATGRKYEEYVKTEIAAPSGIKSWQFGTVRPKVDEPEYFAVSGDRRLLDSYFEDIGGAGAWTSTAEDYVRFWTALRGYKGFSLLKPTTFAQLHRRPEAAGSANLGLHYGLGVRARHLDNGGYNFSHTGSLPGTSAFTVSLSSGWSAAVIFNTRVSPHSLYEQAANDADRSMLLAVRQSKPPEGELYP